MNDSAFSDSNVLLYLLSADQIKAASVRALLERNVAISAQVLNEITNVARKKFALPWANIDALLSTLEALCEIVPITAQTNALARRLAERYQIAFYDASIAASALLSGAKILYSEDMQHGMVLEKTLRIQNPFRAKGAR